MFDRQKSKITPNAYERMEKKIIIDKAMRIGRYHGAVGFVLSFRSLESAARVGVSRQI